MVLQTVFIFWLSNLSFLWSSAEASVPGPGVRNLLTSEVASPALTADTEVYNGLKYSLVRISSISDGKGSSSGQLSTVLQLQEGEGSSFKDAPHREAGEESVGSGFFVDMNPYVQNVDSSDAYTIITNAHVVKNAKMVNVQLPSLGQQLFNATVPMICFDFDLAIVKIANSSEVQEALAKAQANVQRIKLQERNVRMGMRVAALGFPLGSQWLKVSEGLISGVESVSNGMVFQSSAPISPGNSGGPLLKYRQLAGQQVLDTAVGVNFATASSDNAQNLNYVVPAFRVAQLLKKYNLLKAPLPAATSQRILGAMGTGTTDHMNLKLPPVGVLYTKSTSAQINKSGCRTGIQIDRIGHYSVFRWAEPAITQGSFLVKVDGVDIDTFGMGNGGEYMQQIVDFQDLLTFRFDEGSVDVTTCQQGTLSTHTVNLTWNSSRYEPGIRLVQEPVYDESAGDVEIFAGAILAPLSQNMVQAAVQQSPKTSLARFLMVENQIQPKVVIASCQSGSTCSDILMGGMIVDRINGCNVSTIEEVRACFEPAGSTWELVTDRGVVFIADFQQELAAMASGQQPLTSAVKSLLVKAALRARLRAAEAANDTEEERREDGEQEQQQAVGQEDDDQQEQRQAPARPNRQHPSRRQQKAVGQEDHDREQNQAPAGPHQQPPSRPRQKEADRRPGHPWPSRGAAPASDPEDADDEATDAIDQGEQQVSSLSSSLDEEVAELEKETEQLDIVIQKAKEKARRETGRASSLPGRRIGVSRGGLLQPLKTEEESEEERSIASARRKALLRAEVSADGKEALS